MNNLNVKLSAYYHMSYRNTHCEDTLFKK